MTPWYTYAFVRKDLPKIQQLVQVAHATQEAGKSFKHPDHPTNLVVCGVENFTELDELQYYLENVLNVKFEIFFEPDYDYGFTAICTEPICQDSIRQKLKHYQLLVI